MSLSSTATLKAQLTKSLGPQSQIYFDALTSFVTGKTSRIEFEETVKQVLTTSSLLQTHNALIISLFDATATLKRLPSPPPPPAPKQPPRKRRRTLLPYQGPGVPDEVRAIRSGRLKRWALSMGKRERERLKIQASLPPSPEHQRPRMETDEIACERGVELLPENDAPPGFRPQISLHASTRGPTVQHVADRIALTCAQHGLHTNTSKTVAALMSLACEAKLKQLITHALTLTSSSSAISSISPSSSRQTIAPGSHHFRDKPPMLTVASLQTLFTVSQADLPNKSAAAMRFAMMPSSAEDDTEDLVVLKDREIRDQRWQIMALLGERSTVRDSLRAVVNKR